MTAVLGDAPSVLDRFSSPLYTVAEAARYLDVPASTLATWAKGYRRAGKGRHEAARRAPQGIYLCGRSCLRLGLVAV